MTAGLQTVKAGRWISRTPSSSSPPTWAPSSCWTASAPTARSARRPGLKHSFRPEFLNRLDEIVFYKPLTRDNITHIIDLMVGELNGRLADKQLTVRLTDAAKSHVIESAYDPIYGARPLRRYLQHTVETLISRKIIAGEVEGGDTLTVDCRDGDLTVSASQVLTGEVVDG